MEVSTMAGKISLVVRNVVFTFVVPGTGAILIPWRILRRHPATPTQWAALVPIALGAALYLWCVWVFASVERAWPLLLYVHSCRRAPGASGGESRA